jgi:hypothetical protein
VSVVKGAFTINSSTGAVSLTGKPSYTFTLVATDAAGNLVLASAL